MKKTTLIVIIIFVIIGISLVFMLPKKEVLIPMPVVTNFEQCILAGYPVMESYPRQCRAKEQTFTENIGNELEKANLIRSDYPRPNQTISSPITIKGQARGNWFFEASFPVELTDMNGKIIAHGIAQAKGEWMTTDFVPYEVTLSFTTDMDGKTGFLVLKKDNPSGLPEHDDSLSIPIIFAENNLIPEACNLDAKICPDGSSVGRTGPKCQFASCPLSAGMNCLKDTDCPTSKYLCQETQGSGTVCPSTDPNCVPTHTITAGTCKLKGGNACTVDSQCAQGNLCHNSICTAPIGKQCSGQNDNSCSTGYECVQSCGPPVSQQDDPPSAYFCQLRGYIRNCPICLAKNTLIDTPQGQIFVQDFKKGAKVWTTDISGRRVIGVVIKTSKTSVPFDHKMVKLILQDGRMLLVSPGHPTIDGHTVGDIIVGDEYANSRVISVDRVVYNQEFTYDILPTGETGFYFANGIILDSTLH